MTRIPRPGERIEIFNFLEYSLIKGRNGAHDGRRGDVVVSDTSRSQHLATGPLRSHGPIINPRSADFFKLCRASPFSGHRGHLTIPRLKGSQPIDESQDVKKIGLPCPLASRCGITGSLAMISTEDLRSPQSLTCQDFWDTSLV